MIAFGDARLPLRFWHKVLPIDGGCWIWIAALSNGYGSFGAGDRRTVNAHRHAYLTLVGPVADGLHLDHLCRNRDCVNPEHLEPVTHAENVARGNGGLHQAMKTHCPNGHPYAGSNLKWRTDRKNGRICVACLNNARWAHRYVRAPLRPVTPQQAAEIDRLLESA